MIFVETELYRSIEKYNNTIKHRFYEFAHLIVVLLLYEILLLFSYNPNVLAYNGVDAWFKFSQAAIPHGTLFISLFLIINWGNYIRLDWIGEKDRHELRKDYDEKKKKGKNYKITPKKPFRPNWYYFAFMFFEGFVYGSLIFALLRYFIMALGDIIDPNLTVPLSLDSSIALRDFHTNIFQDISLAFGAGFYEELIFRGFLFVGIAWLANKVKMFSRFKAETTPISRMKINVPKYKPKDMGFWTVVAFGTLIYTLSHYLYPFGDVFSIYTILYRFFFGMIMFIIFVQRNLSVAVWTHTIYDLWYFLFL